MENALFYLQQQQIGFLEEKNARLFPQSIRTEMAGAIAKPNGDVESNKMRCFRLFVVLLFVRFAGFLFIKLTIDYYLCFQRHL